MVEKIQLIQNCQEYFLGGGQIRYFGKSILIATPQINEKSTIRKITNNIIIASYLCSLILAFHDIFRLCARVVFPHEGRSKREQAFQ
jgi:hypothetical protein